LSRFRFGAAPLRSTIRRFDSFVESRFRSVATSTSSKSRFAIRVRRRFARRSRIRSSISSSFVFASRLRSDVEFRTTSSIDPSNRRFRSSAIRDSVSIRTCEVVFRFGFVPNRRFEETVVRASSSKSSRAFGRVRSRFRRRSRRSVVAKIDRDPTSSVAGRAVNDRRISNGRAIDSATPAFVDRRGRNRATFEFDRDSTFRSISNATISKRIDSFDSTSIASSSVRFVFVDSTFRDSNRFSIRFRSIDLVDVARAIDAVRRRRFRTDADSRFDRDSFADSTTGFRRSKKKKVVSRRATRVDSRSRESIGAFDVFSTGDDDRRVRSSTTSFVRIRSDRSFPRDRRFERLRFDSIDVDRSIVVGSIVVVRSRIDRRGSSATTTRVRDGVRSFVERESFDSSRFDARESRAVRSTTNRSNRSIDSPSNSIRFGDRSYFDRSNRDFDVVVVRAPVRFGRRRLERSIDSSNR